MTDVKTHIIQDRLCERAGVAFSWVPGDTLAIYANKHVTHLSSDRVSELAPCDDVRVHQVRLDVLLFHPIVRKLVNESTGVFLVAQQLAEQPERDAVEIRLELIKLSKQYRCIIKACIENLQEESSAAQDGDEKLILLQLVKVFYNIEFLWHLCEIFYIDVTPGETVLPQLLEWVRFHYFQCEQRAMAMLSGDFGASSVEAGMEAEPDYWDTINALVLQGRVDTVRALLRYHSRSTDKEFRTAESVLRCMPVYQVYSGLSGTEFTVRWNSWQEDARNKVEAAVFATCPQLEHVIKLVCGVEDAFTTVQCDTWYQHMVAWLLYTEPTVKSFDLSFHAKQSVHKFGGSAALRNADFVILALMESDLHYVIKLIKQTKENGWFAAHLTNLLYHCGCLKVVDTSLANVTERLHENLLLDYGGLLMTHPSLWQVGLRYLDHCATQGRACQLLLLPRIRLGNEAVALKVVQAARDRDLNDIACSVCKVMGRRSEQRARPGNALAWALRSQDSGYATSLANRFLQSYKETGCFQSADLLNNLGPCMMLCDRLTFVGKYCEFHHLYGSCKFREAASLLLSLIEARLAPKWFWLNLLMDSVPLLESNDLLFSVSDLHKLMESMEELEEWGDRETEVKGNLIRLALARNLDRALVQANKEPSKPLA